MIWIDTAAVRQLAAKLRTEPKPSKFLRVECARTMGELADALDELKGTPARSAPLTSAISEAATARRLGALPPLPAPLGASPRSTSYGPIHSTAAPADLKGWSAWVLAEAAHVSAWRPEAESRFISDVWARVGTRAAPSKRSSRG